MERRVSSEPEAARPHTSATYLGKRRETDA